MAAHDPWRAPPSRPAAYPAPPSRSPRAWWYALPAALVTLAVLAVVAVAATRWDELNAADDGDVAGPASPGVEVSLVRDHRYDVYLSRDPTASVSPGGGGLCVLTPTGGGSPVPAPLRDERGGLDTGETTRDGVSYVYAGSFTAPVSGSVVVGCGGGTGALLVRPDDTAFLVLGVAVVIAGGLVLLALVAFVVVLLLRRRPPRHPPPLFPPVPYAPPNQPYPPPNQPPSPPPYQPYPPPNQPPYQQFPPPP